MARLSAFLLLFCGFSEVWFRVVMPASQSPVGFQAHPDTVERFDPVASGEGLFTVGRLCLRGGEWRVNNAGWNSTCDYGPSAKRKRPLIALFGDSYIEGMLSDVDQHIDAYLPKMLPGTDCYAFGLSGWYLEQYVAVSRYAMQRFRPDVLVIFVGAGDVRESIRQYGTPLPFAWQIDVRGQTFVEVPPTSVYVTSRKSLLARRSALLNYLRHNAQLALPGAGGVVVAQPRAGADSTGKTPEMRVSPPASEDSWRALLPAADFMVERLCQQHPGTPIVFVADSQQYWDRYLPTEDLPDTPLFPDGRAIQSACKGRSQVSFIDLRFVFSRDWASHQTRFEAEDGSHWNAYANRLVAGTLADFLCTHGLIGSYR